MTAYGAYDCMWDALVRLTYIAIKTFADRLIAYKHNLVHIINIASPNPANWYLEDTLRYGGINFKYSATNTKYGIAWVSDTGCYLYDGNKVTNLIERKLGVNEEGYAANMVKLKSKYPELVGQFNEILPDPEDREPGYYIAPTGEFVRVIEKDGEIITIGMDEPGFKDKPKKKEEVNHAVQRRATFRTSRSS